MDVECNDEKQEQKRSSFGARHVQVVLLFLASALGFSFRANLSLAIVDMTDKTKDGHFDWSPKTKGMVLSSFIWGYVVLALPAGSMAARFGGKALLLISIIGNSVAMILTPTAASYGGPIAVCICRLVQGVLQGVLVPSIFSLTAKWVPLNERSSLCTFAYVGSGFGTAFQLMTSGFIAHLWGWPAIFYIGAALGIAWSIVYYMYGADCPETCKHIDDEEKKYIQCSLEHTVHADRKLSIPWKAMLTSPAFLSLIIAHTGNAWGVWMLLSEIPAYFSKVLQINIKYNGVISALPYMTVTVMALPFVYLTQFILRHKVMSITASRKLCNSIAYFGAALSLVIISFAPLNIITAIIMFSLAVGLVAGSITGFFMVYLDMAANFAGTMMGITNGISSFISIFGPVVAGFILKDDTSQSDWRKLFCLTAGVYIVSNLTFLIFATSEQQPWNNPDFEPNGNNKLSKKKTSKIAIVCDNVS